MGQVDWGPQKYSSLSVDNSSYRSDLLAGWFESFLYLDFFLGSLAHFFHDSVDSFGVKWFSPLSSKRCALNKWSIKVVLSEDMPTEATWFDNVASRPIRLFIRELVGASILFLVSIFWMTF